MAMPAPFELDDKLSEYEEPFDCIEDGLLEPAWPRSQEKPIFASSLDDPLSEFLAADDSFASNGSETEAAAEPTDPTDLWASRQPSLAASSSSFNGSATSDTEDAAEPDPIAISTSSWGSGQHASPMRSSSTASRQVGIVQKSARPRAPRAPKRKRGRGAPLDARSPPGKLPRPCTGEPHRPSKFVYSGIHPIWSSPRIYAFFGG